jgi:hypothetical protein
MGRIIERKRHAIYANSTLINKTHNKKACIGAGGKIK